MFDENLVEQEPMTAKVIDEESFEELFARQTGDFFWKWCGKSRTVIRTECKVSW